MLTLMLTLSLTTGCGVLFESAPLATPALDAAQMARVSPKAAGEGSVEGGDALLERVSGYLEGTASAWRESSASTRYTWTQAPVEGEATVISRTLQTTTANVEGTSAHLVVRHQASYPYPFNFLWEEYIEDGKWGYIDGADTFGGESSRSMASLRLGLRLRELSVTSPRRLLGRAFKGGAPKVSAGQLEGLDVLVLEGQLEETPVKLVVDARSAAALRATWLEDRPLSGDVEVTVEWGDYRAVKGVGKAPFSRRWSMNGRVVQIDEVKSLEAVSAAELPPVDEDARGELDEAAMALGKKRSRFYGDWIGYGFPQGESAPAVEFEAVQEGIWLVTGGFHNALVVELDDARLALIEAPFSPETVDGLLDAIDARWPGRSIEVVVNTHFHEDHSGGLRSIHARKIPIVTPAVTSALILEALRGPKTVLPDALAKTGDPGSPLVEVATRSKHTIKGAAHTLEVYSVDNIHAPGMLIIYFPGKKLLYNADLYNPGLLPTSGLTAAMQRAVIDSIDETTLQKAGTYAADLYRVIVQLGLDVEGIVGGHGPEVTGVDELEVLFEYADREAFLKKHEGAPRLPTSPR